MSIPMWHEIFKVIFIAFTGIILGILFLYQIAEISYKKAHKNTKVVRKVNSTEQYCTVFYNIDSKNKTLQEIQAERRLMKGVLYNA